MKTVYLVRHGIALPSAPPEQSDGDRPLTDKGRKRMHQVAQGLSSLDINVERIVSSPLPRASQTAEILADELDFSKPETPAEVPRIVKTGTPELFPLARKLQAGE